MDSSSGGTDKDGDPNLHDHSDLLIPNPSFSSPPSSVMSMTSPSSSSIDHDLQSRQMDCQMSSPQEPMSTDFAMTGDEGQQPDGSPPNVVVDDSPLQPCMDRNKESLKVKLQLRRPMNQLVEQGILPPPKTPAAFAGQRVRLERARMGDLLKAKIQQRPARQELIRQHILEDTDSRVAPSLAEKQRMLKRARLADSLNDHLIHRPGPLELVQKNILHAPDADIEKAIKEGFVSFKATSEGHVPGPSLPNKYTINEDDSSSDISSPAGTPDASSSGANTEANTPISKQSSDPSICLPSSTPATPAATADLCEVSLQPAKTNKSEIAPPQAIPPPPPLPPPPPPLPPAPSQFIITTTSPAQGLQQITAATPATLFQVAPATVIPPPPPLPTIKHLPQPARQTIVLSDGAVRDLLPQLQSAGFQLAAAHVQKPPSQLSSTLGKTRSSKKSSKSKSTPKARTIKFHEYKGPSSCGQKGGSSSSSSSSSLSSQNKAESSYELLLKQQQLFLQWQLEWQHKYPQILLPAAPKVGTSASTSTKTTLSSFPVTTIPASLCTNLINGNNQQSSQQTTFTVASTNASGKSIPVALAPKITEIAPKPPPPSHQTEEPKSVSSSDVCVPSPASSTCSSTTASDIKISLKPLNLANIGEWKVNDLKAELKKRGLPVSGSKSQLVERLKTAAAKESSSSSSSSEASSKTTAPVTVKMEVTSGDENSSEAMIMDTNEEKPKTLNSTIAPPPTPPTAFIIGAAPPTTQTIEGSNFISLTDLLNGKVNGVPIPLQSILSLLGVSAIANVNNNVDSAHTPQGNNNPAADNNLKNVSSPPPPPAAAQTLGAKVISQLPISALVTTAAKEVSDSTNNLEPQQQKQIKEVKVQPPQKDSKNNGPQEHRQVLRQHIQQKQKIQSQLQLQNLLQLQTQQAEQNKKLEQEQAQAQLVLVRSNPTAEINGEQPQQQQQVTLPNNVLPVTIVNPQQQQQQRVTLSNDWLQTAQQQLQQQNQNQAKVTAENLRFEDLVQAMDPKDIPKLDAQTKSQMVDDVLEILIRHGELPPSAAQDPHSKARSHSLPAQAEPAQPPPPPPPPLPPPTFSVMLPTTIPFSRHHTTSTTDFLTVATTAPRPDENLSKDAQEILRICEDLSNFGKSREAEAAALAAGMKLENPPQENNNSSTSLDFGFFSRNGSHTNSINKDFDLSASSAADSMDIGLNDTHSSVSTPKVSSAPFAAATNSSSPFDFFSQSQQHQSLKNHDQHHHHQHNDDHHFESVDELVSLDMQMDTDYSDWLDTLLPTYGNPNQSGSTPTPASSSANGIFCPSNVQDPHQQHQDSKKPQQQQQNNLLHNNNNFSNTSPNHLTSNSSSSTTFGAGVMDDTNHLQNHHGHQRDPLLSSRSFTTGLTMSTVPFNSFLFSAASNLNPFNQGPASVGSSSSGGATLMDTDFDEVSPSSTCHTTKKSENHILDRNHHHHHLNHSVIMPELPSNQTNNITTPITTSSINDNFLWDI